MHFYLMCALCKLSTSRYPMSHFAAAEVKLVFVRAMEFLLDGVEELWLLHLRAVRVAGHNSGSSARLERRAGRSGRIFL